jgi:hypothetical protein
VSNGNTLTFSDTGAGARAGGDDIIFSSAVTATGFNIVNGNTVQVACFAEGTRIETENGPVAVEALTVGDRVVTTDWYSGIDAELVEGETLAVDARQVLDRPPGDPIVWIGHRTVDCERHPKPETVWPVRVSAGAFGERVPVRDLYLSPDHAIFVNGVLVPVKLLVNGTRIAWQRRPAVTYYHLELPRHAVILAEGLPVESYLDLGDRANFHQNGESIRLFSDFAARLAPEAALVWETRGAAPLVMTGEKLAVARRMVAGEAEPRAKDGVQQERITA